MTKRKLVSIMVSYLNKNFTRGATKKTVFSAVLRTDDGEGRANSKAVFYGLVRWKLSRINHEIKDWPDDWIDLNLEQLAEKIY